MFCTTTTALIHIYLYIIYIYVYIIHTSVCKALLAHAFWVQCYSHPLVCSESWHKFFSKQITCVVRGAKRNLKIAMIISEGARSWWIYIHFLHLWDQDPGYPHQAQLPFANFHRRPNTWWVLGAMLSNRRPEVDEEKSLDRRDLDPMEDYKKSTLPSWCLRFDSWKTGGAGSCFFTARSKALFESTSFFLKGVYVSMWQVCRNWTVLSTTTKYLTNGGASY